MKTEIPTAFPWAHGDMTCTGMTLRDYFASQIIPALYEKYASSGEDYWRRYLAEDAYSMADEMLKARERD